MANADYVVSLIMTIAGCLSLLANFSIILTHVMFPELRKKDYHKIVFFIAVSDFFASMAGALGLHKTANVSCWIQGLLTNYFQLASSFWCLVIIYLLYSTAISDTKTTLKTSEMRSASRGTSKRASKKFRKFHIICWTLPLVLTLLPLTTDTFGPRDKVNGDWCFVVPRNDYKSHKWTIVFWYVVSFYLWLWLTLLGMISCYIKIKYHIVSQKSAVSTYLSTALSKLKFYPIILGTVWSVTSVTDLIDVGTPSTNQKFGPALESISTFPPMLFGLFTALAYFSSNSDVRTLIYNFWCKIDDGGTTNKKTQPNLNRPVSVNRNSLSSRTVDISPVDSHTVETVAVSWTTDDPTLNPFLKANETKQNPSPLPASDSILSGSAHNYEDSYA